MTVRVFAFVAGCAPLFACVIAVQDMVVDFIRGTDVRGRKLVVDPPRYQSVEDAAKPRPQRGGG